MTKNEDLKACCAHLTLRYRTRPVDDMCVTGYWYCGDCCNEFNITRPTFTPTDGDAERALKQFDKEVSKDGCIDSGFHQLKVFHPNTVKTIRAALQSTRKQMGGDGG